MTQAVQKLEETGLRQERLHTHAPAQTSSSVQGVIGLWLLFWPGLVVWWALMGALFREGAYGAGLAVAYAMPTLYSLAAWYAARRLARWGKLPHMGVFLALSLGFAGALARMGAPLPTDDAGPYVGIALVAGVMSLMQYPKAGVSAYERYRTPLFLGGVIFMPMFIYFAAMLPNVPLTPAPDKAYLFPLGMVGFWASAAWLAASAAQGEHVPGLELKPLVPFRPDFILPGEVNYVKGTVLMGVGLMVAIHPRLGMPQWNWWGFVFAFWGIITLIPLRGMYKMVRSRRLRMLGLGGTGFGHEMVKGLILFGGLLILLYGFVNAFFGTVPFQTLGVTPEFNAFARGTPAGQAVSVGSALVALLILVPLRGWVKTRLLEGVEARWERFLKQFLLWLGTLLLLIGFVHLLNLPPIRDKGTMAFYAASNPLDFGVGSVLFLAGSTLILSSSARLRCGMSWQPQCG